MQVLLNVLADEIHRAHQRCTTAEGCDPNMCKMDLVLQAGAASMQLLQGAYSCICLIGGVGLVAFRDPYGIRSGLASYNTGLRHLTEPAESLPVLRQSPSPAASLCLSIGAASFSCPSLAC